jgi:hypothetical protein
MRLVEFFVRNLTAADAVLDQVERVQRQARQLRQTSGKRRFSTAGVSENRHPFHSDCHTASRTGAQRNPARPAAWCGLANGLGRLPPAW